MRSPETILIRSRKRRELSTLPVFAISGLTFRAGKIAIM